MPKNERGGAELFHILSKQPKTRVEWQRNHTDIDADRPEIALCVYLESTFTMVVSEVTLVRTGAFEEIARAIVETTITIRDIANELNDTV